MKLLNRMKKQVAVATIATLALSVPVATMANDYSSHWAKDVITEWNGYGVVKGYEDGSFKPNNNMTRAEFAVILSNVFGLETADKTVTFSDVKADAWYHAAISKVAATGMMQGADGKFNPSATITRQEAAVALVNAYHLAEKGTKTVKFTDAAEISAWAKEAVELMASHGYITGREDGKFDPKANITRAEVIKMIDNMTAVYINKPGTYTVEAKGNVIIACKGVILKDMNITGNVYLAQGVKVSDVTFTNVKVTGSIFNVKGDKLEIPNGTGGSGSTGGSGGSGSTGGSGGNEGPTTPAEKEYIKVASITVDGKELLNHGITIDKNEVTVDMPVILETVEAAGLEEITEAKVAFTNLKENDAVTVTVKAPLLKVDETRTRTIGTNGTVEYSVVQAVNKFNVNKGTIINKLKEIKAYDHVQTILAKFDLDLEKGVYLEDGSINVATLLAKYEKALDYFENQDQITDKDSVAAIKFFKELLADCGGTLEGRTLTIGKDTAKASFTVQAGSLEAANYSLVIKF